MSHCNVFVMMGYVVVYIVDFLCGLLLWAAVNFEPIDTQGRTILKETVGRRDKNPDHSAPKRTKIQT